MRFTHSPRDMDCWDIYDTIAQNGEAFMDGFNTSFIQAGRGSEEATMAYDLGRALRLRLNQYEDEGR